MAALFQLTQFMSWQKRNIKALKRKISKILAKYECKDEPLLDEGKMSEADQTAYSILFETRQGISNLLSQLIILAD